MLNYLANVNFLLLSALLVVACLSIRPSQCDRKLNELKRELYEDLLDEINESLNTRDLPVDNEDEIAADAEDDTDTEYKRFFRYLIDDEDDGEEDKYYEQIDRALRRKHKRFLGGLKDLFRSKNKTKPAKDTKDDDFYHSFLGDEHKFTTKRHSSTTTKSRVVIPGTTAAPHSATADDPFYRLKNYCSTSFDQLCSSKKNEMGELVKKCQRLKQENPHERLEPCREVLSVYCYTFYERSVCASGDYDTYIPGQKKYTTKSPATSTRTIKVEIITQPATYKPITTTTKSTTTTKKFIMQSPTTTYRPLLTTTKSTTKSGSGGEVKNPFNGPVSTIPNSADKLKEIGSYCLATKSKDQNCDKMLKMLKDKFKACEKMPKTDKDCQVFKVQFCTAYNNFPCCTDVLAGRACSGKGTSAAKRMIYAM